MIERKDKKVVPHSFEEKDGTAVEGSNVYMHITKDNGGVETRRIFVSNDRLAEWAHIPQEGDNVLVFAKDGKVIDMLKDVPAKGVRSGTGASSGDALPFY